MARVGLTDDAKDDIRGLDGSVRVRVLKDLQKLGEKPSERGAPLGSRDAGNLTGLRKLYVGPKKACRAVFMADGDVLAVVMVVAARSEAECYQLAVARLHLLAGAKTQSAMVALLEGVRGR